MSKKNKAKNETLKTKINSGNVKKNAEQQPVLNTLDLSDENVLDKRIRVLFCLIVGFVPVLVFGKLQAFYMPVIETYMNFSTSTITDFFTYYKQMALLVLTVLMLAVFLTKIFSQNNATLDSHILDIPILIFVFSLCITLLTAEYKTLTLWGGYTRNLGALTYLACAIILFIIINCRINIKWSKVFYISLYPLVIINAIMIVLAYYGINIWNNGFIVMLLSGGHPDYIAESSRIYGTLNHVNYLSGLGSILFAIFAGKALFVEGKSNVSKLNADYILTIFAAVLSATIVFASKSLSGVVTMVFILVLLLGLVIERKGTNIISLLIILGFTSVFLTVLSMHYSSFVKEIRGNAGLLIATVVLAILVFLIYLLAKYWQAINKKKLMIFGIVVLILAVISAVPVVSKVEDALTAELNRINTDNIKERLKQDEFDFPEPKFTWGTGRLYIWKETLKLVAEKPLFGYGFDTLPFEFNQTDPAKIAAMESPSVIIDKPHNVYINMLFGAGIVTFLAFITIVLMVIIKAVRAIVTNPEKSGLIWPVLLGIIAYLGQGMFNDPVQGVESLFWAMLGLAYGLATNPKIVLNKSMDQVPELQEKINL